jgi:hypothetical protein
MEIELSNVYEEKTVVEKELAILYRRIAGMDFSG